LAAASSLFPGVGRPVADLRRDADRQFRARLALYAGAVHRLSLIEALGRTPLGFWSAVILAALAVGLVGIAIEVLILRRIYRAPELFQLLATFAVVLVIKDVTSTPGARRTWSARAHPAASAARSRF